jgi:hypothetical protein
MAEHLAALIVDAERAGSAVEAGLLEVPQHRMDTRRPRRRSLVDDAVDEHGAAGVAARQGYLPHPHCLAGAAPMRNRIQLIWATAP